MNIDEILKIVAPVQGWFSDGQMRFIEDIIRVLPSGGLLVELGTNHGRSCLYWRLVNPNINILTIDPCVPYHAMTPPEHIDDAILAWGNIFQVRQPSQEVIKGFNWQIDCLFVDGDHRYEAAKADIVQWTAKVKSGCPIIVHDYDPAHADVMRACDEADAEGIFKKVKFGETMYVAVKP